MLIFIKKILKTKSDNKNKLNQVKIEFEKKMFFYTNIQKNKIPNSFKLISIT